MQGGCAVAGKVDVKCLAQGCNLKEGCHAPASRHVGLLHVNSMRFEHPADITDRVSIFASRNLNSGRDPVPDSCETFQVIRRYGLFEPANILLGERTSEAQCLLDRVGAIGVDKQLSGADRMLSQFNTPWIVFRMRADFHLDERATIIGHPATKLAFEFVIRISREAAAAIDRNAASISAQQLC